MREIDSQAMVAVFGHSKAEGPSYDLAAEVGRVLGESGYAVVNGGYGGAMEASAKGAVEAGSVAIGVTCEAFRGVPNRYLSRNVTAANLQQRVQTLVELATAGFVILPGGTGTLLELATAWELMNKKFLSSRPIICLGDYWRATVESIGHSQPEALARVRFAPRPEDLRDFFPRRS